MPNYIEKSAKSVQEAIDAALIELNANRENVEVEILDEGAKGIFGLIGSKQARVRVTLKETGGEKAKKFLLDLFSKMKVNADVSVEEKDDSILIKIEGEDIGIVIGRRGETLDSLQYLTSLVVNKSKENYKRVVIDIENYRQKREETLVKLANKLADRVMKYKKNITLEPMNPYERRVIHSSLQNHKYVQTYSVGDEPNRKVIITLK
ncbi:MAG TPA: RNA-binding cell elongation regulator Jag/EloR [Acetivibrio sp.]|jgi:spoIIIJ-associated protein|nr:protein jag [Clostridium sp.]HOQ36804.1 RNA-binding cell elongation regulator Jag/EloR [Acetivibrio sp.]HPT90415.1 RNA-binding cell elongation regulator Jag/EloR [Acetivibrio sp.]HQA56513.1 RNA-binding cell elongation regulator Jag/EloR [Acetivibrio sp.]